MQRNQHRRPSTEEAFRSIEHAQRTLRPNELIESELKILISAGEEALEDYIHEANKEHRLNENQRHALFIGLMFRRKFMMRKRPLSVHELKQARQDSNPNSVRFPVSSANTRFESAMFHAVLRDHKNQPQQARKACCPVRAIMSVILYADELAATAAA